ncbi:unnamed protein product [Phytophthora lilii]|uniref:Unnamed protein product n=1 Tax=Phytophthora lilii TaxID=2077276 RepID=A0A9W6TED7_9STRA|nr:unnamed protein product [Phytophthora lilii]
MFLIKRKPFLMLVESGLGLPGPYEEQQSEDIVAEEEEINYASPFLVEIIATNVQEVILQANGSPTSLDLEIQVPDNPDALHERTAKNVLNCCPSKPLYTTPASTSENVVYSATDKSDKAHSTLKPEPPKQRPSSASPQDSGWVTMSYGGKLLHFEKSVDLRQSDTGVSYERSEEALADANHSIVRQSKPRPSSSPCYLSSKKMTKAHDHNSSSSGRHLNNIKMWAPTRAPCALCERRFMRTSLPGVVVMKHIYDLRRKWGVIQDSKKYNAPSALYGTANVCLLCQEILANEESKKPTDENVLEDQQLHKRGSMSDLAASRSNNSEKENEIARMIHDSIMYRWHQEPLMHRVEDNNLQDIAVNKRVRQSSTVCSMKAQNALHSDTNRAAHTKEEFQPWWEIDLANYVEVHSVKVYLRDEVSHLYAAAAANPGRHTTGVYPLHISISMKTGVGRDCDDIITSCVSSLCVTEKMGPPIEWVAPQRSRGRFVRIQCEGRAILHIERVHVYVAKPEPKAANDPVVRRQHFRQKLQRAAFCASVIATTATPVAGSAKVAVASEPTPKRRISTLTTRSAQRRGSQPTLARNESLLASALFFDPERAEKRRISRLYTRFKSLLDARVKYIAPEVETDDEENGGDSGPNEKQTLAESK